MDKNNPESQIISCSTIKELPQIAEQVIVFADKIKVLIFVGDLGAGKTTFIKELCKHLGVGDEVSSPTFSIINEYRANEKLVYHFDFYRLKNVDEATDIGVVDYFYSGNYCFIEWPQKVDTILPDELVMIHITGAEGENRVFKLTKYE